MKVRHLAIASLTAVVVSLLLLSCTQPTGTTGSTIWFENDSSGNVRFETTDSELYGTSTDSVYTATDQSSSTSYVDTISVKKVSGAPTAGMGMVFTYTDENSCFVVEIDTSGDYALQQYLDSTVNTITTTGTSPNPDLNTGFGAVNQISVARSGSNYTITFNGGSNTVTFTDSTNSTGTKAGFIAFVGSSSQENFPTVPEDVRFQMSAPITVP